MNFDRGSRLQFSHLQDEIVCLDYIAGDLQFQTQWEIVAQGTQVKLRSTFACAQPLPCWTPGADTHGWQEQSLLI